MRSLSPSKFAIVLLAAALPLTARAFSLSPMSVSLAPSGKETSHSFLIDNTGGEKIAVQISMAERRLGPDGDETNPDADDQFVVYPTQLVVEAGEKRTVRVTWAGKSTSDVELAYRIIAEQLPVETAKPDKKDKTLIKMLLRYLGAVYITPSGAEPKLAAGKVELRRSAKKKSAPKLAVTVENSGNAHGIIRGVRLKLSIAGGEFKEITEATLKPMLGQNVLARSSRRFELDWPAGLPQSETLKAELEIRGDQ